MASRKPAATAPQTPEVTTPAAPEVTRPPEPETAQVPDPEPVDENLVEVVVVVNIAGFRNGVAWPAVGEPVELPAHEAEHYKRLGYVADASE